MLTLSVSLTLLLCVPLYKIVLQTEALRGMYRDGQSSASATAPGLKVGHGDSAHN